METVECQVSLMIRPGETRAQIVTVEEEAIRKKCWKPIACIRAAVLMELPFTLLLDKARFGFRKDDKERLFGKTAGDGGTDCRGAYGPSQ